MGEFTRETVIGRYARPIPFLSKEETMIFKKTFLAACLLLLFAQPVFPVDDGLSKQYSACMAKSAGITPEENDCARAERERQDVRLNKAYKQLMAQLSESRKKQLREAQRLWIKYRDANCDFYYDPDGGSMTIGFSIDRGLKATALRAEELEKFKRNQTDPGLTESQPM